MRVQQYKRIKNCEVYIIYYNKTSQPLYSVMLEIRGDYSSMAAWEAATRAMGTRNGEQLT